MNSICFKIYEENKSRLFWYLTRKCPWLSYNDVYCIMQQVWKEMAENIKVIALWNETRRWKWLIAVAYKNAIRYKP